MHKHSLAAWHGCRIEILAACPSCILPNLHPAYLLTQSLVNLGASRVTGYSQAWERGASRETFRSVRQSVPFSCHCSIAALVQLQLQCNFHPCLSVKSMPDAGLIMVYACGAGFREAGKMGGQGVILPVSCNAISIMLQSHNHA